MSMSIPIFGMADHQVATYETDDSDFTLREKRLERWRDAWDERVCRNSLLAVHQHLYRGEHRITKESKKFQEFFVKEDLSSIRQNFQCNSETFRFPHPATLYGMLNIGNAYLPINENWEFFFKTNEKTCDETKEAGACALISAAKDVLENLKPSEGGVVADAWLFDADWSYKSKSEFPEWFYKLFSKRANVHLDYASLSSEDVIMKSTLVPAIFGMTYGPYPLHRSRSLGWGYLVPTAAKNERKSSSSEEDSSHKASQVYEHICQVVASNKKESGDIEPVGRPHHFGPFLFYQLLHPLGAQNVGDPLGKHFLRQIEKKVLRPTRYVDEFFILLEALKSTKFWTNYTKRYESEIPVWYDIGEGPRIGAIAPAIVPAGTVSRRSVHKLWVTLTNESGTNRIGTGIKSLVQAPEGSVLVGADVDSQEQWLAGLFGDASHAGALPVSSRHPGLTPFSNMMLAGSKAEGTDLHTVVANQLHIDRGQAKALNYARMYGAGEAHASKTLAQAGMEGGRAAQTAKDLFRMTKGTESSWKMLRREVHPLLRAFVEDHQDRSPDYLTVDGNYYIPSYDNKLKSFTSEFEKWVAEKALGKETNLSEEAVVVSLYEGFPSSVRLFSGGYESATFNFLEMQTHRNILRTPVLDCRLSDSLSALPEDTPDREQFAAKYKRSVMNWLVQSSAVDFLHLLLVCMEWLCSEYEIPSRFVISIHDEVKLCSPD
ncbi:DNA-directed DNA polymerase [Oesophagostomum dentatum]|uniref:DNA-directed DNA polymerase n=1 Tax=Oesophagostomum dentatum TaxID=61180 RepID=A0A0B1TGD4_OESDE|nr:DNA-directed DNA polymerase [Oesophagostomum dentatum]